MAGGCDGKSGRFLVAPDGPAPEEFFSGAQEVPVPAGSLFRVETPGGAGMGSPKDRGTGRLAHDVKEGRVSAADARIYYGPQDTVFEEQGG